MKISNEHLDRAIKEEYNILMEAFDDDYTGSSSQLNKFSAGSKKTNIAKELIKSMASKLNLIGTTPKKTNDNNKQIIDVYIRFVVRTGFLDVGNKNNRDKKPVFLHTGIVRWEPLFFETPQEANIASQKKGYKSLDIDIIPVYIVTTIDTGGDFRVLSVQKKRTIRKSTRIIWNSSKLNSWAIGNDFSINILNKDMLDVAKKMETGHEEYGHSNDYGNHSNKYKEVSKHVVYSFIWEKPVNTQINAKGSIISLSKQGTVKPFGCIFYDGSVWKKEKDAMRELEKSINKKFSDIKHVSSKMSNNMNEKYLTENILNIYGRKYILYSAAVYNNYRAIISLFEASKTKNGDKFIVKYRSPIPDNQAQSQAPQAQSQAPQARTVDSVKTDSSIGLVSLGYSKSDADGLINQAYAYDPAAASDVSTLIRAALKFAPKKSHPG